MAAETELERIVVRLVGDNSDLRRTYAESRTMTDQTARGMEAAGNRGAKALAPAGDALAAISLKGRDTRKALMLIGAVDILPPGATHGLHVAAEGMELLKGRISTVVSSLGTMKGALIGTGIGALIVGVGALVAWLSKMNAQHEKARDASKEAFGSVVSGARTASQAVSDIRVGVLTKGMQDLADTVNPGFWGSIWNGLRGGILGMDLVGRDIGTMVNTAAEARRMFDRINNDPRVQRQRQDIAIERNTQASRDAAQALEEEAGRSALAERESKRYAEAQRLAREGGIGLSQALGMLSESHARQRTAEMTADIGKLQLQLREMSDEADRSHLPDVQQQVMAMAQEFQRANPAIGSLENAFAALGPTLAGVQTQINRTNMGGFLKGTREQTQAFGLSSERAQLFRMSMSGVADANIRAALAEVKHLEALNALSQPLEKIEGTRAGGVEALHRLEEYNRGLTLAAQTGSMREQLLANQQSGQASPGGMASLAGGQQAMGVQQQAFGLQQFRENVLPALPQQPTAVAGGGGQGFGQPQQVQATGGQSEIVRLLAAILARLGSPLQIAQASANNAQPLQQQPLQPAGVN